MSSGEFYYPRELSNGHLGHHPISNERQLVLRLMSLNKLVGLARWVDDACGALAQNLSVLRQAVTLVDPRHHHDILLVLLFVPYRLATAIDRNDPPPLRFLQHRSLHCHRMLLEFSLLFLDLLRCEGTEIRSGVHVVPIQRVRWNVSRALLNVGERLKPHILGFELSTNVGFCQSTDLRSGPVVAPYGVHFATSTDALFRVRTPRA